MASHQPRPTHTPRPGRAYLLFGVIRVRLFGFGVRRESTLRTKDEQLHQLQSSTWGAWAQDQGINAELGRLQAELSQAHTLNRDLSSRLGGTEETRGNEQRAAEASSQLHETKIANTPRRRGSRSRSAS